MRIAGFLSALCSITSVWATVPIVQQNPAGAQAVCVLPDKSDSSIRGTIQISSPSNGTGAYVQVSVSGLPVQGGPFLYYIHERPVPTCLDCQATGDQLDPSGEGELRTCNNCPPELCQVGDLSGKHGSMTGTSYSATYVDPYLSLQPDTPAFVGNRSLGIQFANGTMLACGNCTMSGGHPGNDTMSRSTSTCTTSVATIMPPSVATSSSSTPRTITDSTLSSTSRTTATKSTCGICTMSEQPSNHTVSRATVTRTTAVGTVMPSSVATVSTHSTLTGHTLSDTICTAAVAWVTQTVTQYVTQAGKTTTLESSTRTEAGTTVTLQAITTTVADTTVTLTVPIETTTVADTTVTLTIPTETTIEADTTVTLEASTVTPPIVITTVDGPVPTITVFNKAGPQRHPPSQCALILAIAIPILVWGAA